MNTKASEVTVLNMYWRSPRIWNFTCSWMWRTLHQMFVGIIVSQQVQNISTQWEF